ncbi:MULTISPECIES: acyltransferase family protein [Mycolicibacterium]|uniref:Lipopolysaccharide biosynthesis acyltransferase, M n=1 Tax=Mycolicibacterium senegalense TaxID=1796 RepID=A0A378W4Q0_9MYCO|nr:MULTISPECIES: acyltransferase family protein [Mycolicibacterium]MCV7336607.1 acyltransferase [Mycolicibacterium senegalense]MDR7291493.1 peptidoglycan/LPS O-acetylase OafA/YrhL [Mycolicibacterium senegalense]QZA22972.1 acyltransferase [Mycolicibacterium senegalense]CDP84259.1 lipopolysaccharide biosynthesis acyltransferase, M [Mycolicibacterium farcinogenes]SUA27100.1 lipopolysaccharide biosynthesis acyltransferase, M [Mycolicibacterium senegalense]
MQAIVGDPVLVPGVERRVRDDLIGLGGVAVVMVVVCHLWFGRAPGGLDVLLVLSGFFIGGRVLRVVGTAGPRALATEAGRVARRLVPPLVLVVAVSAVLTVLVQPQTRWEAFADQTLAGLGFYQNWQLLGSADDYVQAGEAVTPLHHLWAVAVLGQFALAFFLLAGAVTAVTARRGAGARRISLIAASGVAAAASLYYAVTTQPVNPMLAYYSTAARAWELLAGVLAAALVAGPMGRTRWPGWLRAGAAAVGLLAILVCGVLTGRAAQSPGIWTLIPVVATVLVIVSGAQGMVPRTIEFLRSPPLVAIGAAAYPLYLWHWPLLIFWLATINDDAVGLTDGVAILLGLGVLALLTVRWAQLPWRRWPGAGVVSSAVVVLVAAVLVATSLMWQGHVARARASGAELGMLSLRDYPGAQALIENRPVAKLPMRPSVLEADDDLPPSSIDHCVTGFTGAEVVTCVYGDPKGARTIALAGGSHSEHWLTALHEIGRHHGFKVTTYLKFGCPLTTKALPIIAGSFEPYPSCRTWSDNALAQIIADRPDYVFFTSTRPILNSPGDYVPDYYLGIWDELSDNGIPMLGIRDTPWMIRDGWFFSPVDCLAKGGDADACGLPRDEALAERNPTLDHVADYPLMKVLDLSDAVCRPNICRAVEGNVLVYHDAHHLSAAYVRTLTSELARQMSAALGWW